MFALSPAEGGRGPQIAGMAGRAPGHAPLVQRDTAGVPRVSDIDWNITVTQTVRFTILKDNKQTCYTLYYPGM